MEGRNFLVVGPESSGTHYMIQLISANARPGDHVHHRSLPITPVDRKPWWPDIEAEARALRDPVVIICWRHPTATVKGQVRAGWSRDDKHARGKIREAWHQLGLFMGTTTVPYVVSTYGSLRDWGARAALLQELELELVNDVPFQDGNAKYWETADASH